MALDVPAEPGIRFLKSNATDYVNRVIYGRERVWIQKNSRRVAALVSVTDAERLAVLDTWPTLLEKVDAEVQRLRAESAES